MKNFFTRFTFFRKRLQRVTRQNPLMTLGFGIGCIFLLLGIITLSSKNDIPTNQEETTVIVSSDQSAEKQKLKQQIPTSTTKSNVLCKLVDTAAVELTSNKQIKQKTGSTSPTTNMSTCSIAFKKSSEGIRSLSLIERIFESPEQASQYAQTIQNERYQDITLQSGSMMYSSESQQGHIVLGTSYLAITINGKIDSIEQVTAIANSIRLE